MTRQMTTKTSWLCLLGLVFLFAGVVWAGNWTNPVEVRHDVQKCVSYRARLTGEFLVIQAIHEPGWHTFAMDNKVRAQEKLAGKRSLGIDRPTEFVVTEGLQVVGPWYQSEPKDLSKPELRWYSWGFEGKALFVSKVKRLGTGTGSISILGQACSESTCKNIELAISIPFDTSAGQADVDLKGLVQVR